MAVTLTNAIPSRIGQVISTLFSKNNRLLELERRTAKLEKYQAMQHAITQIVARSIELENALPRIIQTICETIGWDFGEVWHIDPETNSLYCDINWHVPSLPFPSFDKSAFNLTFRSGKGLPGRVWAIGKPAWISDVVVDTNFLRATHAERDGLHAGFGIPIRTEGVIIGVMTFFSRQILTVDRDLLHVLETIGSQIGLFIERNRIEQLEREQARQLSALRERQKLARDLHDSVSQTLFSANMLAEMLPKMWEQHPEQVRPNLDELQRLTHDALTEMRSLLVEMRPAVPPRTTLNSVLSELVASVTNQTELQIKLEVKEQGGLDPAVQMTLYRITQEALNNIVKHAKAAHVWIAVNANCERIELSIRDDGRGFDPTCLPADHFGVHIMRERAQEIDARFELNSAIGQGTSITVTR